MTKEEKQLKKQEKIKRDRQKRINEGKPAKELAGIKRNLPLHGLMHKVITINNNKEGFDKDYQDFIDYKLKDYEGRPIIFAPNHVRMQDIEVEMEAIPVHQVLLSGDFVNVHGSPAGIMLEINGIIYFSMLDPYDLEELKQDRKYIDELKECIFILKSRNKDVTVLEEELIKEENSYKNKIDSIINDRKNVRTVIYDVLNHGYNLLWYYEGTWCYSEKNPYNDGSFFIVQAAIDTNAIVVPVVFDMIDHKMAVIRYGDPIDYRAIYGNRILSNEEKKEALDKLKGQIGKGLVDIWEEYNFTKRDDLVKKYAPELLNYPTPEEAFSFKKPEKYGVLHRCWEEYLEKILSEWKFTLKDLESKRFIDKTKVEQDDVFEHLYDLNLNHKNAFLLSKRNHH